MDCNCDDGYYYSPHSCGEPTRSACSRCRPDEAGRESITVFFIMVVVPLIALVAIALCGCVSISASNHSVGIGWQYYVEPGRPLLHRIPQHLSTRETRRAPLSLRHR